MNFNELNINKNIIEALNNQNIFEATDIQSSTIPALLNKEDVIGQGQTGTGKTYAYSIPLLMNINYNKNIQGLVLVPTRELAIQVSKEIKKLDEKVEVIAIFGGASYDDQFKDLKKNPQIVVSTPGRLLDLKDRNKIGLNNVNFLVLDEADEMLKMGFEEDLNQILETVPKTRQTALFSATIPPFVKNVANKYMNNPKFIKVEANSLTVENIDQMLYYVKKEQKKDLLVRLLDYYEFNSVMIFTNTKTMVDELVLYLQGLGYKADGLHGDLKQASRNRVLDSYRAKNINILIATDVAARGLDISNVEAIINYDIPLEPELYVHRIGRTARAGNYGIAISFATARSRQKVIALEKYIHKQIKVCEAPLAKDINAHRQKKLYLTIEEKMNSDFDMHQYDNLIMKLSKRTKDPVLIISSLLDIIASDSKKEYKDIDVVKFNEKKKKKSNQKVTISLNVGKVNKTKANELAMFLHNSLKININSLGKIRIDDNNTLIEIKKDDLKLFDNLSSFKFKGRKIKHKVI